jgi:hypothetical protein
MNTRIRTLLAKFKETESTHRGAECLAGLDEIEKFAELIVRECAQVASDYDGAHYVGDAIEQHFGVM